MDIPQADITQLSDGTIFEGRVGFFLLILLLLVYLAKTMTLLKTISLGGGSWPGEDNWEP